MTPMEAAVLGAIQGLTEFLPISSSAHLFVIPTILGWRYGGVAFDVSLHWGTALALLAVYWRDWRNMARSAFAADDAVRAEAHQTWLKLLVATIPTVIGGFLLRNAADAWFRSLPLQAVMLLVFGFLLWWVDRSSPVETGRTIPGWRACLLIGAAQTLALVPGVSRSGVTMTAGRMVGLGRVSSARFSFLLATPITLGAGVLELGHLPGHVPVPSLIAGMLSAAVIGLLAIRGLIGWLSRAGFGAFFAYRTVLALFILYHWLRG